MILAYSPAQYSAFFGSITATMAVITGLVAIGTLVALRRDSRDRTRPVVSAELLPVVLSRGTSELVVRNIGPSVAKNVRVTFDPPIPDTGQMSAYLVRKYAETIPTMGPGRYLTNIYAHFSGDGTGEPNEPVPIGFTVKIKYEDDHGRTYTDSYALTLKTLLNQTRSEPSNTDDAGMKRRLIVALETIARGVGRY